MNFICKISIFLLDYNTKFKTTLHLITAYIRFFDIKAMQKENNNDDEKTKHFKYSIS